MILPIWSVSAATSRGWLWPERVDRDAGQAVEVALALRVEQMHAFAALEGDRLRQVGRHQWRACGHLGSCARAAFDCRVSLLSVRRRASTGSGRAGIIMRCSRTSVTACRRRRETASAAGEGTARFVILGQTSAGKTFRPSDWAERLAGVMAAFRPRKAGSQQHLTYSPYVAAVQPPRHQVRRRRSGTAGTRADGIQLHAELRARQRPGDRSVADPSRSGEARVDLTVATAAQTPPIRGPALL